MWAYDFVFDTTAEGQQIKCLTVIDEYTRECLAIDVAGSIRSRRVVEVLSRLVSVHGAPLFMRSDNGPEFVSQAILEWISKAGIGTALNDPGKPWQNRADESFNGKLRDECLSLEWFQSRREAAVVSEAWRKHYNTAPPHSSLDYMTPHEFKRYQLHNPPIPNRAVLQNDWLEKAEQVMVTCHGEGVSPVRFVENCNERRNSDGRHTFPARGGEPCSSPECT